MVAEGTPDTAVAEVIDDRYKLHERIGEGGMGVVFRATQLSIDRSVAVKILSARLSKDDEMVERFKNEAKIISRLRHPNTLKLIDFGRLPDRRLFIVTELLHGEPLSSLLSRKRVSLRRMAHLVKQICNSLKEAHEAGIIHRDLKPQNIFIERVGEEEIVKVLDFGLAKLMDRPGMTKAGVVFGTPRYMAPEQAIGSDVDARTDLYSLGIIMHLMVTGEAPFESELTGALLAKHINEPAPRIEDEGIPLALRDLVHQLLSKSRRDRPDSAEEVTVRLAEIEPTMPEGDEPSIHGTPAEGDDDTAPTRLRLPTPEPASSIDLRPTREVALAEQVGGTERSQTAIQPPPTSKLWVGAGIAALLVGWWVYAALWKHEPTVPTPAKVEKKEATLESPAVRTAPVVLEAPPPVEPPPVALEPHVPKEAPPPPRKRKKRRKKAAPARVEEPAKKAVPRGFSDVDYDEI